MFSTKRRVASRPRQSMPKPRRREDKGLKDIGTPLKGLGRDALGTSGGERPLNRRLVHGLLAGDREQTGKYEYAIEDQQFKAKAIIAQ